MRLLSVTFSCTFVTFPYGVLGQVWYLIVSIPDLCLFSYYEKTSVHKYSEHFSLSVLKLKCGLSGLELPKKQSYLGLSGLTRFLWQATTV